LTPVFFTDPDLGKLVPELLQEAGINVEKHSDHFPDDVKDDDWLTQVGRNGWFCLTHNKRIRYRPNERDAVMHAGVSLRAPGMTHLLTFWWKHRKKTPTVTGRKGNANKARAVPGNGASEGSMRQNPCT